MASKSCQEQSISLAIEILQDAIKILKKGSSGAEAAKLLRDRADWIEVVTDPDFAKKARAEQEEIDRRQ